MKLTKIISAFPGTGKTHFKDSCDATDKVVADSDSSGFSWITTAEGKIRNPDFPANYMVHIAALIGNVDYILVSSHKEVRDALVDYKLNFTLVFPAIELKEEYKQRYKQRGSSEAFINLVDKNWEDWIVELKGQKGCTQIKLETGKYLSDCINQLYASNEKGG